MLCPEPKPPVTLPFLSFFLISLTPFMEEPSAPPCHPPPHLLHTHTCAHTHVFTFYETGLWKTATLVFCQLVITHLRTILKYFCDLWQLYLWLLIEYWIQLLVWEVSISFFTLFTITEPWSLSLAIWWLLTLLPFGVVFQDTRLKLCIFVVKCTVITNFIFG